MRCPNLIALAFVTTLLSLQGVACTPVSSQRRAEAPAAADATESTGSLPYAAYKRERVAVVQSGLNRLLSETIGHVRSVREQLDSDLDGVSTPERFSTSDRVLRSWHQEEWKARQVIVEQLYGVALERLRVIQEQAISRAISQAEDAVGKRSPLDAGQTGDLLVDQAITSFGETLRAEVSLETLEGRAQLDAIGQIELVQIFSTFTTPGADEVLGGRMLLFVGGGEGTSEPHVQLVLKGLDGEVPQGVRVLQAVRHRVHRGNTVVQDLGWQKMPRGPQLDVHGPALVISNIQPRLDTTADAFNALRDMRIVSDIQTVIVKDGEVRGGLDWRIEFRVTTRGAVSWQVSGVPQFNPICGEAQGAFGAS